MLKSPELPLRRWTPLRAPSCALGALCLLALPAAAEKVLVYDEERGIIFVDPAEKPRRETRPAPAAPAPPAKETKGVLEGGRSGLHAQRAQDPPEVYFRSGLDYFNAHDYEQALVYFESAFRRETLPAYLLWIGKCQRLLGEPARHIATMERILREHPASDVADDALFEIAFSHQVANRYEAASAAYSRLAEQYPFGTSYSNGEEFREIAREQRRMMRGEMITATRLLGFTGGELRELYAQFQRANGLPPTGLGDSITVTRVKELYHQMLTQRHAPQGIPALVRRYRGWAYGSAGVLWGVCVLMLVPLVGARRKMRVVESLEQTLADLELPQ